MKERVRSPVEFFFKTFLADAAEFQMHWKDERCFHADRSRVIRKNASQPNGTESMWMRDLRIGDEVLSTDPRGRPVFSELIAWIDADLTSKSFFRRIETASGLSLVLTPSHSVLVQEESGGMASRFAGDLSPGDNLLSLPDPANASASSSFKSDKIVAIGQEQGTIVVNGIAASCYAAVASTKMAHAAFAPLRWWTWMFGLSESTPTNGLHPYAKLLTVLSKFVLPSSFLFNSSTSKL
jgi:hypothetical protein